MSATAMAMTKAELVASAMMIHKHALHAFCRFKHILLSYREQKARWTQSLMCATAAAQAKIDPIATAKMSATAMAMTKAESVASAMMCAIAAPMAKIDLIATAMMSATAMAMTKAELVASAMMCAIAAPMAKID